MKIKIILSFILFSTALFGLSIKEHVEKAPKGTYIAYEQNGVVSLLLIKEHLSSYTTLEEITIPSKKAPKKGEVKKWIENGAPEHTSYLSFMLNNTTGKIEEMYSYTQEKWYPPQNANALLGTLLALDFTPIPLDRQKKIGTPPADGEPDRRKIWKPTLIREGKVVKKRAFDVYNAHWPKDGSELSEKEILVYLDQTNQNFPFPYWIEVEDAAMTYKLRARDSGSGAQSPYPQTPMRPLKLITPLCKEKDSWLIKLYALDYHLPCTITLLDTRSGKQIQLKELEIKKPTDTILEIRIPYSIVEILHLPPGFYQISILPEGKHPSLACITPSFKIRSSYEQCIHSVEKEVLIDLP